jgi:hypothetical protein
MAVELGAGHGRRRAGEQRGLALAALGLKRIAVLRQAVAGPADDTDELRLGQLGHGAKPPSRFEHPVIRCCSRKWREPSLEFARQPVIMGA